MDAGHVNGQRCGHRELAFLAPPSQRWKARYMNVDKLVAWAEKVLAVLDGRLALPAEPPLRRLEEKLGWLKPTVIVSVAVPSFCA